jgi:hypothetical protein
LIQHLTGPDPIEVDFVVRSSSYIPYKGLSYWEVRFVEKAILGLKNSSCILANFGNPELGTCGK